MTTSSLFAVFILFSISLSTTWAMSFFPCPGPKGPMGAGVSCKVVKLPPGMCQDCALKAPAANGQFKQCFNIYETSTATCKASMNKYVQANPCDGVRKKAMDGINSGNPSYNNLVTMDYFMYSVCEQCCDCIPIGASKTGNSGQWVTERGNCPAHAWYDICAVLPKVTWFVKIGESTAGHGNKPSMCNELTAWSKSPFFAGWQKNPKTTLTNSLDASLASVLDATSCSASSIWNKCFDLEKKQGNLGNEGDFQGTGNTGSQNTNNGGNNNNNGNSNNNNNSNNGNSNSGGANTGCTGAVKWGCIDWSAKTKKCEGGHKCKCFPNLAKSQSHGSCAGKIPVGANTGGSSNSGNGNSNSGNSNNNNNNNGNNNSGGNNPGGATQSCNGAFKWGCAVGGWNAKLGKCTKHGCKCFPGPFKPTPDSCFKSGGLTKQNIVKANATATCFPGDATVVLGDGSVTEMTELKIGDVVMSGPGKYSQIYLFSHRHRGIVTEHVEVSLDDYEHRPVLTLTGGHHLRVNGILMAASKIRIGDTLETVDGVKSVRKLRWVVKEGLYNPHTLEGSIVVNGVVCSTYTEEIDSSAAHALLAPMRTLFRTGSVRESTAGSFMQYGASTVA